MPPTGSAAGALATDPSAVATQDVAKSGRLIVSAVGALGVVFGDLATSPLYTLKECLHADRGVAPRPENVFGVLSLIFWALTLVVAVKYLVFLMRVENDGEGGILALLALAPERPNAARRVGAVALLGLVGAALLYGDGIITPTVSVLSALEGLADWAPALRPTTVPIACVILLTLFWLQRRGSGTLGRAFGPVMVVWLVTIGLLGAWHVVQHPGVLRALSPTYAIAFFAHNGWQGLLVLGTVVLAVTGCEALYADMGHFGRRPIRVAWMLLAFPALVLCYFGQGAVMLANPQRAAMENSFYALVPQGSWTLLPLVVLATAATVIASQALISGVFSLTSQAVQLGLLPRLTVRHTSEETRGQIYVPLVNWALAAACLTMTISFGSSSRLAGAFGLAVSGTMFVTSLLYFVVVRRVLRWSAWRAGAVLALFLMFDLPFVLANLAKIPQGGWIPLAVGSAILLVMVVWTRGRLSLDRFLTERFPLEREQLDRCVPEVQRLPTIAVFMANHGQALPAALGHFLRRMRALPETVLVCSIEVARQPRVPLDQRMSYEDWGSGIYRVTGRYGFQQTPNIPALVRAFSVATDRLIEAPSVTYVVGREEVRPDARGLLARASEALFAFLARNAPVPADAYRIPPDQIVEIGVRVDV